MAINEQLDNEIREALLGIPCVRDTIISYSYNEHKTIDEVLDLIVARIRVTNLQKVSRRVRDRITKDPVLAYITAAKCGVVKDPVIK